MDIVGLLSVEGAIQPPALAPFSQTQVHSLIYAILNDKQITCNKRNSELDFALNP